MSSCMVVSVIKVIVLIVHAHQRMHSGVMLLLGGVATRYLQCRQIVGINIIGHVVPIENRTVELVKRRVDFMAGRLQVLKVLIEDTVSTDQFANFGLTTTMRSEERRVGKA